MKLALMSGANPNGMTKSHPSFIPAGKYRIVAAGVMSKLTGRRTPVPYNTLVTAVSLGDTFEGSCLLEVLIIEAHPDDKQINVFAEKIDV